MNNGLSSTPIIVKKCVMKDSGLTNKMKFSKLFAPRQNRVAIGRLTLILTVTLFPADHSILSADWAIFTNTGSHWSAYSNKIVFKSFSICD